MSAQDPCVRFMIDERVTQLFKGESGIGKTSMMLCGCCDFVDLVVYVNIGDAAGHSGSGLLTLQQLGRTMDKRGSDYIDLRNETMMGVAVMLVEFAVGPDLHASLCHSKERFNVRLVFDKAVRMHEFVPGLCAAGGLRIRERLKWSERVIVHTVAGGTGVGSADNLLGSGLERYYMTALEPNRHLWDEMEAAVMRRARARGVDAFTRELAVVFARVKSDHFCDSACGNPRLAALMVIRCWNVASLVVHNNLVRDVSNDVRRHVLLPAAKTFKSLCGLRRMFVSKEFRDTLVSALSYALHPDFHDNRPDLDAECLVSWRGVLMDNSYVEARSRVTTPSVTVMRDGSGQEIADRGTGEVACYPTLKGRYSISPGMVVVLHMLHFGNTSMFGQETLGDTETALAQMLYVAVQVFEGRPVVELLEFLFAGKVTTTLRTRLKDKLVTFSCVELRRNRTPLQMSSVMEAKAEKLLAGLWRTAPGTAWVEVSPCDLPSADVVLHIPGVLTLPIVCKDAIGDDTFDATSVECALDKMLVRRPMVDGAVRLVMHRDPQRAFAAPRRNGHCAGAAVASQKQTRGGPKGARAAQMPNEPNRSDASAAIAGAQAAYPAVAARQKPEHRRLAKKLETLSSDAVVVPVICLSRGARLPSNICLATHNVDAVILVDGYGEVPPTISSDNAEALKAYQRQLMRRSIFPYTLEVETAPPETADTIDAAFRRAELIRR